MEQKKVCSHCLGTGKTGNGKMCIKCNGTGWVKK